MAKPTEVEIKAAISAADKARTSVILSDSSDRVTQARNVLRASRKETAALVEPLYKKAGLDIANLANLQTLSRNNVKHALQQRDTADTKRPDHVEEGVRTMLKNRLKAAELFRNLRPPLLPLVSDLIVLKTPLLVWPTPGISLVDNFTDAYGYTIAKIESKGDWTGSGSTDKLRFIYTFENPSDKVIVFNIWSGLLVHGACDAWANSGIFDGGIASMDVSVDLAMWSWWENQTSPYLLTQNIASLRANGGSFLSGPGNLDSQIINGFYQSNYDSFAMPGNAFTLFEMNLSFYYTTDDGYVEAAFATAENGYEVLCPGLWLTLLTYTS